MNNTVSINIEFYFNLRYAARCRRNPRQVEAAQRLIIRRHVAFALQYVNFNACLVVCCGREHLRLLYRNRCITLNQLCAYAAQRFNTERKRSNVEQEQVLYIAAEHAALNRRTDCNTFVRVDTIVRVFARDALYSLLYSWDTRRTADH